MIVIITIFLISFKFYYFLPVSSSKIFSSNFKNVLFIVNILSVDHLVTFFLEIKWLIFLLFQTFKSTLEAKYSTQS